MSVTDVMSSVRSAETTRGSLDVNSGRARHCDTCTSLKHVFDFQLWYLGPALFHSTVYC